MTNRRPVGTERAVSTTHALARRPADGQHHVQEQCEQLRQRDGWTPAPFHSMMRRP